MIKFETDLDINRPVRQVFDTVADLKNAGKWASMATTKMSDGPVRVGTTYSMVTHAEGKGKKSEWQITEFEQDKKITMTGTSSEADFTARFGFDSVGAGTRIHYTFDVQPKGLMKLLEPFIGGEIKKEETGELKKLKAMLEA